MPTEEEKRLHRCCFSGHRPEKLTEQPEQIQAWLREQIEQSVAAGYTTFISGCGMGVDIWAGQIVIRMRDEEKEKAGISSLRLIAATPWPGFSSRWSTDWQQQYSDLLQHADLIVPVSKHYGEEVFQKRNRWMVDHSNRLIAFFNGAPGGTRDTIEYAQGKGIEVISNNPEYEPRKRKPMADETIQYPENLIRGIGVEKVFGTDPYTELTPEQIKGLEHAISQLSSREADIIRMRYQEHMTLQEIGEEYAISRERVRQLVEKSLRRLRSQKRIAFIRDGYEQAELTLKIACAKEIRNQLAKQKSFRPQMSEEDVVKFAFQGMLGVGHLVASPEYARARLEEEYDSVKADDTEPLTEKISTEWIRLNLRPAKARGISVEEIAECFFESARKQPLSFTRENVYNFCVKMEPENGRLRMAAAAILVEKQLPGHSDVYRENYHPAYRVLHKESFKKMLKSGKGGDSSSDRE